MNESYTVFFDLETGGIEPFRPTIQIAAVAINDSDWREVAKFEQKISFNEADADPEALKLNHYTKDAWAGAIPAARAASRFAKWSEPYRSVKMVSKSKGTDYYVAKLAGHNALTFDLPRLRQMFGTAFFPFVYHVKDTLQRALWFFDEHPEVARPASLKLTELCNGFGIPTDGAHDALFDVRLAAALARGFGKAERNGR